MRNLIAAFGACLLTAVSAPAMALDVADCDWRASAQAIVEPWAETTRTFANGKTRIAVLDTIEPGAAPLFLLVLSPPYDELGGRQCRIIGVDPGIGFGRLDFAALQAGYDPSVGLMFELPVSIYDGADFRPYRLNFTVNQATGHIGADLR